MSKHGNGSQYDSNRQAAELHDKAEHTHSAAATTHGKQDHQSGHEQTRQALEHSNQAFQRSQDAHRRDAERVGQLDAANRVIDVALAFVGIGTQERLVRREPAQVQHRRLDGECRRRTG